MGSQQRLQEQSKKKKSARRYQATPVNVEGVTWAAVNQGTLLECVLRACEAQGALRIGMSRDGGALALGVYGDGDEAYTLYAGDADTMNDHLAALTDVFEAIAAEQPK